MKNLLYLISVLIFASTIGCSQKKEQVEKPNIIVFFVDDLGYNDLGFRNEKYHTPHIDKLRKESLVFENAYVPSSTCSPSRAGLLTGQHPARLGFYRHCFGEGEFNVLEGDTSLLLSRNWLFNDILTYGDVLKGAGYNTFFVGKWHLGGEEFGPAKHGFDAVVSKPHHGHPNSYYPPYFNGEKPFSNNIPDDKYLTELFTDTVVGYLNNYDSEKPFLINFSYHNVHSPNQGDKRFLEIYKKQGFEGGILQYGAQVTAVDKSVGRVLDALKAAGKDKNTIVIFSSDQGSGFPNTPLRGGKKRGTALYEGGTKVPFIIKWPGVTKPGSSNETHIQTTDVFPTFVQIVGDNQAKYKGMEGVSLVDLLKNGKPLNRTEMFAFRTYDAQYASVLTSENWKLIAYLNGKHELYKVDEDISEQNNLAAEYPEKVKELLQKLEEWKKRVGVDI